MGGIYIYGAIYNMIGMRFMGQYIPGNGNAVIKGTVKSNKGVAICNNISTLEITGNAKIITLSKEYCAIENHGIEATLLLNGGTITSNNTYKIYNNKGTITIKSKNFKISDINNEDGKLEGPVVVENMLKNINFIRNYMKTLFKILEFML